MACLSSVNKMPYKRQVHCWNFPSAALQSELKKVQNTADCFDTPKFSYETVSMTGILKINKNLLNRRANKEVLYCYTSVFRVKPVCKHNDVLTQLPDS